MLFASKPKYYIVIANLYVSLTFDLTVIRIIVVNFECFWFGKNNTILFELETGKLQEISRIHFTERILLRVFTKITMRIIMIIRSLST